MFGLIRNHLSHHLYYYNGITITYERYDKIVPWANLTQRIYLLIPSGVPNEPLSVCEHATRDALTYLCLYITPTDFDMKHFFGPYYLKL